MKFTILIFFSPQTSTHVCLITDFCPGGELFALLDKQPLKIFKEESARYFEHAFLAVDGVKTTPYLNYLIIFLHLPEIFLACVGKFCMVEASYDKMLHLLDGPRDLLLGV